MEIKRAENGLVVPVLVNPGASRNRICGEHAGRLKVAVSAPPEGGKANEALRKYLAKRLKVSRSRIQIISGQTSRQKEVLIERVDIPALEAILS